MLPHDEQGYYHSFEEFTAYLKQLTAQLVGSAYPGVDIVQRDKAFSAYDGTSPTAPRQIGFQDLIGQPTYLAPGTLAITTVLRADTKIGDYVKLPPTAITNSAASLSQFRSGSAFQGVYLVNGVRHVGHLRQPDAASWTTIFTVNGPVPNAPNPAPASPGSPGASSVPGPTVGPGGTIAGPV